MVAIYKLGWLKSCGAHKRKHHGPPEPGYGEVSLVAAAKTRAADVCQRFGLGDIGVLQRGRKPGLKKKWISQKEQRWRGSLKMGTASLHPREHPAGPECVSKQMPAPQAEALDSQKGLTHSDSLAPRHWCPRWTLQVSPCAWALVLKSLQPVRLAVGFQS